jgi:hypothetical protein
MKKFSVFMVLVFGVVIGIFYFVSVKNEPPLYSDIDSSQIETLTKKEQSEVSLQEQANAQSVEQMMLDRLIFKGIDQDLLDWYFSLPAIDPDKNDFNYRDSELIEYELKFKEDPESYLELAGSANIDNEWLYFAIQMSLPYFDNELLLPYLDQNYRLANMAFNRGLHKIHKNDFQSAIYNWQGRVEEMPKGLILAAIENDDKAALDITFDYAVSGAERLEVFEALESSSPGLGTMETLADKVWRNYSSNEHRVTQFETAYLAAKYGGYHDAIMVMASLFDSSTELEKSFFKPLVGDITSIFNLNQFSDVAESLVYKVDKKIWVRP